MSSAFDTIRRETVLNVLADAGCTEDELHLVRILLCNTALKVSVNGTISSEFESTLGAFQGDCLSGDLFTVTLAAALHHLRAILSEVAILPYKINTAIPNHPISALFMPLETEYADDVDFSNEEMEPLDDLFPVCQNVFSEWDLTVNDDKTERTHFYLATPKPEKKKIVPGTTYRNDEEWRQHKVLGSVLCSSEDIKRRCILGNIAFCNFNKIWSKTNISINSKHHVYEAQVVSIMIYNSNSWALFEFKFLRIFITSI